MPPHTNNQVPPFHDPLIQCVNRAYYHFQTTGSLVGIHGGQLYRQFTSLYNNHPDTIEKWAVLDDIRAIQISTPAITHDQFNVKDTDLMDVQALVPAEQTLDDKKVGLLNEMLWGAAHRNAANHCSAQQRRAQRKQTYDELEDGMEMCRRRTPRQSTEANLVPYPNMELPPVVNNANLPEAPIVTAPVLAITARGNTADNPVDDDLISLGDKFEPREPMDIDGIVAPVPSTSSQTSSNSTSVTDTSSTNISATITLAETSVPTAPTSDIPITKTDLHSRKTPRTCK